MATEEKKGEEEEKKRKEIMKSSELRWRVSSIIVSIGWLVFLILWFVFYASDYTVYQNIVITLVSILIMGAILGVSWTLWDMKYCWNGEKEKKWWQLNRIAVGVWVIIVLIAFGILQPLLWEFLPINSPTPTSATTMSSLLTIVIALFALVLTGFSVLIYEVLHKELTAHITKDINSESEKVLKRIKEDFDNVKSAEDDAHERIKKHINESFKKLEELSDRRKKETEICQTLFRTEMLRSLGTNYWQLFLVWVEVKKPPQDPHAKKISEKLIKLALEKAKISLDLSEKLPEKYKEDIYKCKNNWIYFLAEAARAEVFEPTRLDKELALKFSYEIFKEVCKEDYQNYYHYWESCAWALQHLSEKEDENSKQKAHDIIREILNDEDIKASWLKETEKKWKEFLEEKNGTSTSVKNA